MFQIAFEEVNSGAGGEAEVLLKYLVDLAGMLPVLFKPHLTQLWATGLALASNVHASDALRKLAVELLVSLCEGKLSATIRKQSELLQQLGKS